MKTKQKVMMHFITKDRIRRFGNTVEDLQKMSLFHFLNQFFDKDDICQTLTKYDVRSDERYHINNLYSSVFLYKDSNKKIKDAYMELVDPCDGNTVFVPPYAYLEHFGNTPEYMCGPCSNVDEGTWYICKSLNEELSKGYKFVCEPTLFGMNLIEDDNSTIYICSSPISALFLSILYSDTNYTFVSTSSNMFMKEELLDPNILKHLKSRRIALCPDVTRFMVDIDTLRKKLSEQGVILDGIYFADYYDPELRCYSVVDYAIQLLHQGMSKEYVQNELLVQNDLDSQFKRLNDQCQYSC